MVAFECAGDPYLAFSVNGDVVAATELSTQFQGAARNTPEHLLDYFTA